MVKLLCTLWLGVPISLLSTQQFSWSTKKCTLLFLKSQFNERFFSFLLYKKLELFYKWCASTWFIKVPLSALRYGQTVHSYGFSPVWLRICLLRLSFVIAEYGQYGHENGFSPVWVRMWFLKLVATFVT